MSISHSRLYARLLNTPCVPQVRVAVHQPIIALREKDFRPLIETAYYSSSNFHFDLTRAEALRLLEMLAHRQVSFSTNRGHCNQSESLQHTLTNGINNSQASARRTHDAAARKQDFFVEVTRPEDVYLTSSKLTLGQQAFQHGMQVMYHQHLQHRLGNPFFVPPAMCQQLLEAARQASKPAQQPAHCQQPYTNAYLSVLEKGLTTQKKPAKRSEEETPPDLPALDDIVSLEAGGLEPGEIETGGDAEGRDDRSTAAELAQDQHHSQEQRSAEKAVHDSVPTNPETSGAQSASAGEQQAQGGARSGSSLLERFDAVRQPQSRPASASAAISGGPTSGAAPAKPSPLGRPQLPMLSPLVLASAPHHTPLQPHASSAPAAVPPAACAAPAQQSNAAEASNGQAIAEATALAGASPEEHSIAQQPASSFSFQLPSTGALESTPTSLVRLLQECASAGSQAAAAPEPAGNPMAAEGAGKTSKSLGRKRRRERRQKLRETLEASILPPLQ